MRKLCSIVLLLLSTSYILSCYDLENPINIREIDRKINVFKACLKYNNLAANVSREGVTPSEDDDFSFLEQRHKEIYASLARLYCLKQDWDNVKTMLINYSEDIFQNPNQAENENAYFALFQHYYKDANFREAKNCLKCALEQFPNNKTILTNLGFLYHDLGKYTKALYYFDEVLKDYPTNETTLFAKSRTDLTLGSWENGFKHFELRNKICPVDGDEKFIQEGPMWNGKESLEHKTVLVIGEKWFGFGDFFQFIRYTKLLKENGAHVIAVVREPLVTIMKWCSYLDRVISVTDEVPNYDFYVRLISLPYYFNTTPNNIPLSDEVYLNVEGNLPDEFEEKINRDQKFKIGLCYQGNKQYVTSFGLSYPSERSILLNSLLQKLSFFPDVSFYLLNPVDEQITPEVREKVTIFEGNFDENGAFTDTARLAKKVDVIVSIDSGGPNLFGACGAKVFLLLQLFADWRWMQTTGKSEWYKDVTIFRQEKQGDWSRPLEKIKQQISAMIIEKYGYPLLAMEDILF